MMSRKGHGASSSRAKSSRGEAGPYLGKSSARNVVEGLGLQRLLTDGLAIVRIEQLPKWLLCVPLTVHWLYLGIRWRSLTLPSAANPRIYTGGLAGESKSECLAQIGASYEANVATWFQVSAGQDALAARRASALPYPLIAKPDIGWCGYGVRLLREDADLLDYAAAFPPQAAFVLQRYITGPCEAGLYYRRWPGDRRGCLLAATMRHAPTVVGDGKRTVGELLAGRRKKSRASRKQELQWLARVPAEGERIATSLVASLRAGASYEDVTALVSPCLASRIDAVARSMGAFHVGRFDVRFSSLCGLQRAEFSIIEVNGAGSEAIHYWDPKIGIGTAFKGVFAKQEMLFQLGDAMRRRGHRPIGLVGLARAWLAQQRLISKYPLSD